MLRGGLRLLTGLARFGWLGWGLSLLAGLLLAPGCSQSNYYLLTPFGLPHSSSPSFFPVQLEHSISPLQQVAYSAEQLPEPGKVPAGKASGGKPVLPPPVPAAPAKLLSLDLLAVLRLTEEHNAQIALHREKVHEAEVQAEPKCGPIMACLADCLLPTRRLKLDSNVWEQRAELSRVTSETLQDAGNTYVDLVTARRGEAIARELEVYQLAVLERAEKMKKIDVKANVLVESVQTEVTGRRQALARLHQQGDAAAAKLAYLLGLPCDTVPVPVDQVPGPLDLVDLSVPVAALIAQAQTTGPGVQELHGLLGVLQGGLADMQCRWHLCQDPSKKECLTESKVVQVELSLQDLCGKLAAGVQEAYAAIPAGRSQIAYGAQMIQYAREAYRLSDLRLKENAPGATITEVMQAIRALEQAYIEQLSAISAHNKAEVRLLLFLGPNADKEGENKHLPPATLAAKK